MTDAVPPPPPPVPEPRSPGALSISPGSVKLREPLAVALLSIITFGIYHLYWTYQVFRELKETTREGIGPVVALVIGIFVGFVNWFLLPSEIGNMYERAGKPKPVSGLTGFWNFLPIIGFFVWTFKVQGALNRQWEELGATR
jgi:hypothetical protein